MSGVDKIITKMRNQPHGIQVEEAHKVLVAYGYRLDRQKGSHRQYIGQDGYVLTIPVRNPLKRYYIDVILDCIGKG
jgi:predicted RNA binding protein YcfA (HicA-like mRNA interferase family)